MIALGYERRHRVLMVRFSGVMSSDDLEAHERLVLAFLAREGGGGTVRGLYDFSAVEVLAIPTSRIRQIGQKAPIVAGSLLAVAPNGAGRDFVRLICEQRRQFGQRHQPVVDTLAEALALLGLDEAGFEPVENGRG